jgi:hypothetical protein
MCHRLQLMVPYGYGAQSHVKMGISTIKFVVSSLAASDVILCIVHSHVLTWESVP